MMDVFPVELEKHLILNPERFDTHPRAQAATGNSAEQVRHKADPRELGGDMTPSTTTAEESGKK